MDWFAWTLLGCNVLLFAALGLGLLYVTWNRIQRPHSMPVPPPQRTSPASERFYVMSRGPHLAGFAIWWGPTHICDMFTDRATADRLCDLLEALRDVEEHGDWPAVNAAWLDFAEIRTIQPFERDASGVVRFRQNAIVRYLLDRGPFSLNDLAELGFTQEDEQQFAQLIGYSLAGYASLPYVDSDAYGIAQRMAEQPELTEEQARIAYLEGELRALRSALRAPMARLYDVAVEDLGALDDIP